MAHPRRLLWQIAITHVRRPSRDWDAALAEKMQAHIATLPDPSRDSSDRSSEQISVRRSDPGQHPAYPYRVRSVVPDLQEPTPVLPPALRAISEMDPLPRAILILCVHHHVPPSEIARRFGITRSRVRKYLRLAISTIAAAREQAEP
ncbi:sigma-70 region 4 domain-containing protein [Sphingobium sp.]|uniref:sigma-70 region 4 domain-containing protein n=1 Tax=Sphingobium sp. TaxID=1912891 RepID=UPI002CA3C2CD|nr:sigma-70 region 4 domain-containing protein [Sphingobium sp.]HUD93603.1 sigma-70 region 4 domain-containing protein [Sphingobium sp.]